MSYGVTFVYLIYIYWINRNMRSEIPDLGFTKNQLRSVLLSVIAEDSWSKCAPQQPSLLLVIFNTWIQSLFSS